MIAWLLLALALPASAQEASTNTLSVPIDTQIEISNLGKAVLELQGGRPRFTGLPTFGNGIKFADGTTQTTAAGANVAVASTSILGGATYATTSTNFGPCITGSTITFTTTGGEVMCSFSGGAYNDGANTGYAGLLVDGAAQSRWGATGMTVNYFGGTNLQHNFSFTVSLGVLAAGSHSVCATIWANAGTTSMINDTGTSQSRQAISCWEVH